MKEPIGRCDNGIDGEYSSMMVNDYCLWCVLYFQVSPYYVQFLIYYNVFSAKKVIENEIISQTVFSI